MSLRYRDSSGNETIVSGLTPGGDIEAGAVAQKEGYVEIPGTAPGGNGTATVTFTDGDMPDDNYYVIFRPLTNVFNLTYDSKTKSGFNIQYYNVSDISSGNNIKIYWIAVKTYTVQHAAQNAEDIAEIKSVIPAGAGSSNKLVTTTQFNNAVNPLTESIADIQDAVPADASITNKLVSQETLDNTLEEADEGIWEVMGKNGAKNKLPFDNSHMRAINGGGTWNVNAYTYNGITYTLNSNGTITVNGTATAYSIFRIVDSNSYNFKLDSNETYYLTGSPTTGSSSSTYYVYYSELIGGTWTYYINYGKGDTQFTPNASATQVVVDIIVRDGQSISSQIFKPMIRLASDPDTSYQPYAMTNQQLTPIAQSITNPNLLDNPWFTINQRGLSTYTGTSAYSVDRWYRNRNNADVAFDMTVNSNGILLTKLANYGGRIWQKFETINNLVGRQVTATILYKSTIPASIGLSTGASDSLFLGASAPASATWAYKSFTGVIPANTANLYFAIAILNGTAAGTFEIKAVKLELGSMSTLNRDTAPNYQQELAKCQRYFQRFGQGSVFIGFVHNATTMYGALQTTVPMRTTSPTVTKSGTILVNWTGHAGSNGEALDTFTLYGSTSSIFSFGATIASSSLIAGQCAEVNVSTNGYIDLSADL